VEKVREFQNASIDKSAPFSIMDASLSKAAKAIILATARSYLGDRDSEEGKLPSDSQER